MNIWESLRTSLSAIGSNKMRSILTMLGIIIGVGAVIALSSVGAGVETMVSDTISDIGSNLIYIQASTPEDATSPAQLTMADAETIGDPFNVPAISAVAPSTSGGALVTIDDKSENLTITGTTPELAEINNLDLALGSFVTNTDIDDAARVAVIGSEVYEQLFDDGEYPIDRVVSIDSTRFTIIGVLDEKGGMLGQDSTVYIPITTAQARLFTQRTLSGDYPVNTIAAMAASEELAPTAVAQIETTLRDTHGIDTGDEDDFRVTSQEEILEMSSDVTSVITAFLSIVAGISLLVGGIGIMNIMLVTVTERTREIGIRKAIGATKTAILSQFVIEAVVLTLTGGIIGAIIGIAAATLLSGAIGIAASVTVGTIALAAGISTAIGLVFGTYPAMRAANLRPIEALRYE